MTLDSFSTVDDPHGSPGDSKQHENWWHLPVWFVLLAGILLSRFYLVLARGIYYFDESLYLIHTHALAATQVLSPWSWSPGVTLLNLPWYLLFENVALGLDYTSRMAMLVGSLGSFFLLALIIRALSLGNHWLMLALALCLVAAPFWNLRLNSSDSYYGVFILLYLVTIQYAVRRSPLHWSWLLTAAILAFSMTLRNDGAIVFLLAGALYTWRLVSYPVGTYPRLIRAVLWVAPLLMLVGLYWTWGQAKGGYYDAIREQVVMNPTSVSRRTYVAFEQGVGYLSVSDCRERESTGGRKERRWLPRSMGHAKKEAQASCVPS